MHDPRSDLPPGTYRAAVKDYGRGWHDSWVTYSLEGCDDWVYRLNADEAFVERAVELGQFNVVVQADWSTAPTIPRSDRPC